MSKSWKWFGGKQVIRTVAKGRPKQTGHAYDSEATLVEERVVLVRARNLSEALQKTEADALRYVELIDEVNAYGQRVSARCIGVSVYGTREVEVKPGFEVFSNSRVVPKSSQDDEVLDQVLGENDDPDLRISKFVDGDIWTKIVERITSGSS